MMFGDGLQDLKKELFFGMENLMEHLLILPTGIKTNQMITIQVVKNMRILRHQESELKALGMI
jgi:hypothetical protein